MFSYIVLIFFVSSVLTKHLQPLPGTLKCYCNLPECAATDNLCTTDDENGACFSDFLDFRQFYKARQGCLHLLSKPRQEMCGNAPGSTGAPRSLLLCCQVNMCNQLTHALIGSFINATDHGMVENSTGGETGYNNHEVWFKAATIAVPICGAMILAMLVALACKILRSDHVTVDKLCHDASNATSELNQYTLTHSQDAAKKVPLLYEARQNCENFRNFTSTRIHYGQNVNVLKEVPQKPEKNVNIEYARVNEARSTVVVVEADDELASDTLNSHETLDVREDHNINVPSFNLNLEKNENVESCNIFATNRPLDSPSTTDKCIKYENNLV